MVILDYMRRCDNIAVIILNFIDRIAKIKVMSMQPMVFYGHPFLNNTSVTPEFKSINFCNCVIEWVLLKIIESESKSRIGVHVHKVKLSILITKPDPPSFCLEYKLLNQKGN